MGSVSVGQRDCTFMSLMFHIPGTGISCKTLSIPTHYSIIICVTCSLTFQLGPGDVWDETVFNFLQEQCTKFLQALSASFEKLKSLVGLGSTLMMKCVTGADGGV